MYSPVMALDLLRFRFGLYPTYEGRKTFTVREQDINEAIGSIEGEAAVNFTSGGITIGIGEQGSLFYFDKVTLNSQDKWIYKSKPLDQITSKAELVTVVRDFIQSEPAEAEIIDVSKEALNEKMNARKNVEIVLPKFEKRKKG